MEEEVGGERVEESVANTVGELFRRDEAVVFV